MKAKTNRELVFNKFGGKCAYCGVELTKGWHVDELLAVKRNYEFIPAHWINAKTKEKIYKILMDNLPELNHKYSASDINDTIHKISLGLKERDNWISVESAPKDGSYILGYDPDTESSYKVFWNSSMGDGCWNYEGRNYIPKITHWQPLPKAPNL